MFEEGERDVWEGITSSEENREEINGEEMEDMDRMGAGSYMS